MSNPEATSSPAADAAPARPMTLQEVREVHQPSYTSRQLGGHPITGRPLHGWSVACSCGDFARKSNENKRSVESDWKFHTREVWEAQRGSAKKGKARG